MAAEHTQEAERLVRELGRDTAVRQISMSLFGAKRDSDPEMIDYWTAVLKAVASI